MKPIMLYNPAAASLNLGDEIIFQSCIEVIHGLFPDNFYINVSTHQSATARLLWKTRRVKTRFVCGSNLLDSHMAGRIKQWHIMPWHVPFMGPAILLGVGWRTYQQKPDFYTNWLWNTVLSKAHIHSVRDAYTEEKLKQIGVTNVLNTGCPTIWNLSQEFCADIPKQKADNVVCTITDYRQNLDRDRQLLRTLAQHYKTVYFWTQGLSDSEYLKSLQVNVDLVMVSPSLKKYDELLSSNLDIEFVGTRLHAGIRALQHKRRSLILGIDNRAREKQRDINLPVILPEHLDNLGDYLIEPRITEIKANWSNIDKWKAQFL